MFCRIVQGTTGQINWYILYLDCHSITCTELWVDGGSTPILCIRVHISQGRYSGTVKWNYSKRRLLSILRIVLPSRLPGILVSGAG
jgi:hypothetical protein